MLISDKAFAGSDTLATSYILSKAVEKLGYDLIVCGKQSVDGDTAQVGPMLSEMCGCNLATNVLKAKVCENALEVETRNGNENVSFPALITVERSYVLRFPGIFSKPGTVETMDNTNLCCDVVKCGLLGSPTRVLKTFQNESGKRHCKFVEMSKLEDLIKELSQKQTVQLHEQKECNKLESVWAVGEDVAKEAEKIAENVIVLPVGDPVEIAERAKKEKPDVILVHGDTTTAFAAALCGFWQKIPVVHIEAGLRTYRQTPFPEEFNRRVISFIASLHFAPTETAREKAVTESNLENIFIGNADSGKHSCNAVRPHIKVVFSIAYNNSFARCTA